MAIPIMRSVRLLTPARITASVRAATSGAALAAPSLLIRKRVSRELANVTGRSGAHPARGSVTQAVIAGSRSAWAAVRAVW